MIKQEKQSLASMRLVHYSKRLTGSIETIKQNITPSMKPSGLWLSVDSHEENWRDWCESENYNIDGLRYVYNVSLYECANILLLTCAKDIDIFTLEFRASIPIDVQLGSFDPQWMMGLNIDWHTVAKKYDGIIIAPYIWERRLDEKTRWYYGWDCASGCIWNSAAIKEIKLQE